MDIMLNIHKVYYIIDEILQGSMIVQTNDKIVLGPLLVLDNIK